MSIISMIGAGEYDDIVSDIESTGRYEEFPIFAPGEYTGKRMVRVWKTEFLIANDGSESWPEYNMEGCDSTDEFMLLPTPAAVVYVLRNLDLSFSECGCGNRAASLDGSENNGDSFTIDGIEYEPRREFGAELFGFTNLQANVIAEYVDDWQKESKAL